MSFNRFVSVINYTRDITAVALTVFGEDFDVNIVVNISELHKDQNNDQLLREFEIFKDRKSKQKFEYFVTPLSFILRLVNKHQDDAFYASV